MSSIYTVDLSPFVRVGSFADELPRSGMFPSGVGGGSLFGVLPKIARLDIAAGSRLDKDRTGKNADRVPPRIIRSSRFEIDFSFLFLRFFTWTQIGTLAALFPFPPYYHGVAIITASV